LCPFPPLFRSSGAVRIPRRLEPTVSPPHLGAPPTRGPFFVSCVCLVFPPPLPFVQPPPLPTPSSQCPFGVFAFFGPKSPLRQPGCSFPPTLSPPQHWRAVRCTVRWSPPYLPFWILMNLRDGCLLFPKFFSLSYSA